MKVEENRIVLYFDYQPGTCHTNLASWKKKNSMSAEFGSIFSWKILSITIFFKSKIGKNSSVKETL